MIFQEYLDCPPSDFFDGVDTGYLLESFAKKHMTYTVSQHNCDGLWENRPIGADPGIEQ